MSEANEDKEKLKQCVNLFAQITDDDDPLESWLSLEKKIERFGVAFVFDQYFDLLGSEGDASNFKWCMGSIIHEYFFGSDEHHLVRATRWLIEDLVHAGQGNFGTFITEDMEPYRKVMLAEFARHIGCYTGFWGFNQLGPDAAHSIAWLFQQVADTGGMYDIKNRVNKPISDLSFKFRRISSLDNPIIFMSLPDALFFMLAIMVVIEPDRLFSEPTPEELATFVENIYDDSLGVDELEDLKYYKSQVQKGAKIDNMLNGFQFSDSEYYDAYPGRQAMVASALEILIKQINASDK